MEHYEVEDGCYVLYLGTARVAASDSIALLLDADSGELVTHGDPRCVRREFDALCALQPPESTSGWLLLEGRPALAALNRALRGEVDIHELHLAFTRSSAQRVTNELIARLRQRRRT
jgi:hypothetical protein